MEPNTRYLTLALDVRMITDSLIDLVEEDKELPEPNDLLKSFISSLTESNGVSVKGLSDMGGFGNYESLRTINEIFDADRKEELKSRLQTVNNRATATRQKSALEAIKFLDDLERTALYHYEHPGLESRMALAK